MAVSPHWTSLPSGSNMENVHLLDGIIPTCRIFSLLEICRIQYLQGSLGAYLCLCPMSSYLRFLSHEPVAKTTQARNNKAKLFRTVCLVSS